MLRPSGASRPRTPTSAWRVPAESARTDGPDEEGCTVWARCAGSPWLRGPEARLGAGFPRWTAEELRAGPGLETWAEATSDPTTISRESEALRTLPRRT